MYELTRLIHEPDTGRVFIEVTFTTSSGAVFPIMKWLDPLPHPEQYDNYSDEDKKEVSRKDFEAQETARAEQHTLEIETLLGNDKKEVDAYIESLGGELLQSLKHPNVDIIDENNELKVQSQVAVKQEPVSILESYDGKFKKVE